MITDTAPFRYPHYHTAKDTPDKIDYERMARVVRGSRARRPPPCGRRTVTRQVQFSSAQRMVTASPGS